MLNFYLIAYSTMDKSGKEWENMCHDMKQL